LRRRKTLYNAGVKPRKPNASERLGRFLLGNRLGQGSMGVIYRSADPHTGAPLALKTLRRDLLDSGAAANFRERLALEAAAGARLIHPGIVRVAEHGEADGRPYLALEYVEGISLHRRIEAGSVFSIPTVIDLLRQLLDALEHAHERGVWHRDVKPSNLLIGDGGQLKLIDFGIAELTPPESASATLGAIMGTPGYIAPETYMSEACDGRVDLFAAGAVLYHLLTGQPAFAGTADAIMFQVCSTTPEAPSVAGRVPHLAAFDGTVERALARRAADRFAAAAPFREALLQAYGEFSEAQTRGQSMPRRRP